MSEVNVDTCGNCGYVIFPRRYACPQCRSTDITAATVSEARVLGLTASSDGQTTIAHVELEHGDVLVGRVTGDLKPGQVVPVSPYPGVPGTVHVPNGTEDYRVASHPLRSLTLPEQTLPHIIQRQAEHHGAKPFIEFETETWSYDQAADRAAASAGSLRARGIDAGESIAVLCGNRPEFVELFFGAAWSGASIVPINTAARSASLRHVLADSGAKVLFVESELTSVLTSESVPESVENIVLIDTAEAEEEQRLSALAAVAPYRLKAEPLAPVRAQPSDILAVLYTSGTTGLPKGVACPHAQFYWFGINVGEQLELDNDDVLLTTLPLFHTNALTALIQTMLAGATIVVKRRFSASRYWQQIVDHRVTCGYLLGAMIAMLYSRDRSEYRPGHTLRRVLAPATPPSIARHFIDEFGVGIVDGYASTESNALLGCTVRDYRPGYIGRLSPDYEARIVDERGIDVPDGVPGELLCRPRSPFAFSRGYVGNDSATATAFRDLWFHTGDRLVRDKGGWYRFVDRIKDSIRRRGENISSVEVESAVLTHPAVGAVAAYAVPSELAEDEVMVALTLRAGSTLDPAELVTWLDDRLPYFAVPRFVDILDELPVTENGKINKVRLRERGVTESTWDGTAVSTAR